MLRSAVVVTAGVAVGGDQMLKKVLTWGGIAFVIYYLATSPDGAANVVTGALDWLKSAGNSMSQFLNHIKL
jgi:arginine exporter protein ArgO